MWIKNSNRNHSPQSCLLRNQRAGWLEPPNHLKLLFKIKTIRKSFGQAIVSGFGETFPLSEVTMSPATNLPCVSHLLSAQEIMQPPGPKALPSSAPSRHRHLGCHLLPHRDSLGGPCLAQHHMTTVCGESAPKHTAACNI